MPECQLCGESGKELSLMKANHKEKGRIMVCRDCWNDLYSKNDMRISGGSEGSSSGGSPGCATCGI